MKINSAYWHFNSGLLHIKSFREVFRFLWISHKKRVYFFISAAMVSQIKKLEIELVELQSLVDSTGNQGHSEALKVKKAALASLLEDSLSAKVLASRRREVMSEVVHVDQTVCPAG